MSDGSFARNKLRYEAFSAWVKEMRDRLLHMNADHPAISTQVHPVLVTKEERAEKEDEKMDKLITAVKAMTDRFDGRNRTQGPNVQFGDPTPVDECRYCKILLSDNSGTIKESTVYAELKHKKFDDIHKTWLFERLNKYMLSANWCLLWLHATIEQRVAAIKHCGTNILCKICLAVPSRWNSGKTQCAGRHTIRKREGGAINQICMENDCESHFTICKEHRKENKKHPLKEKAEFWVKEKTARLGLEGVGMSCEIVMLLPDVSPELELGNVLLTETELEKVDDFLHNCSIASQYSVKTNQATEQEEHNTGLVEQRPSEQLLSKPMEIEDEPEKPTVLIAGQTWNEETLPEGVTMDKTRFLNENKNSISHEVIDRTEGTPVYLFIDLYGNNGTTVRTVFDSGAMVSVWLTSVIMEGKLNSWIDPTTKTSIKGVGEGDPEAS